MNLATSEQLIKIHNALARLNMLDEKQSIVLDVSDGRCTSSRNLFYDEAQRIIDTYDRVKTTHKANAESEERLIKSIFGSLYELGRLDSKQTIVVNGIINQDELKDYFYSLTGKKSIYKMLNNERMQVMIAIKSKITGIKAAEAAKQKQSLAKDYQTAIDEDDFK